MKKIILIFDGENFSNSAFDFASRLNEIQPILLTGVFLPAEGYKNIIQYYGGMEGAIYVDTTDHEYDAQVMSKNIDAFKALCIKNGIEYRIHSDTKEPILDALSRESRYADLLVLSSELFYSNLDKKSQLETIEETVHETECPVILLPEDYKFPNSNVLAYDGSESSVFAIKQFAYLFPELAAQNTIVVHASEEHTTMPDFDYIKELLSRHFSNLEFLKLDVDPKEYFKTWFVNTKDPILVAGSYGRSSFSEVFKRSFANEIVNEHKFPVFIAHK